GLTISTAIDLDETSTHCRVIAPTHHYLESWGDAEPVRGHISMIQPAISPLFDTRQREMSLLKWIGGGNSIFGSDQPYFEYLKSKWAARLGQSETAWTQLLHDGVYTYTPSASGASYRDNLSSVVSKLVRPGDGHEITFMETVAIGSGAYANNPWLQEMADPITRCTWGNYLALPVS